MAKHQGKKAMRSLSEVKDKVSKGALIAGKEVKGLIKKAQHKLTGQKLGIPVYGEERIMSQKMHGTCMNPPMPVLKFGVDHETVDKMCCFNRKFAE